MVNISGTAGEALRTPRASSAPRAWKAPRQRGVRAHSSTPWLFLVVPLAFLVVFTYIPVANMFWYSVTSWDGLDPEKVFVGFKNYIEVFTRPEFWQVFAVSLYYICASFVQLGLALYFATVLSFKTRFRNLFKGVLFFPYLVNGVAISFIFLYFFQPGGTIDSVLAMLGVANPPHWLGDPHLVNYSLAATSIWRYTGLNFVLFLGAIQSIPGELYEAAEIDGASRFQQFRYIIAPGIKRIISLLFILAISGSLSVFEIPFIMTGGANQSTTFVIKTVQTAFVYSKVGLASALAVVLLIVVLIVTWIQRKIVPDEKVTLS